MTRLDEPRTRPLLHTARLLLRPLVSDDYEQFAEVRHRCRDWLEKWEPRRPAGTIDPARDPVSFAARCSARDRERQLGTAFAFGIFADGRFVGEVNVNNVLRGAFMSAHVGYWIDESVAGRGYVPEGVVGVFAHMFDEVGLHRLQIAIIPRNAASLRVVEKLGIRPEGLAVRYLQINGRWEDHLRFGMTVEDWEQRRDELTRAWLLP